MLQTDASRDVLEEGAPVGDTSPNGLAPDVVREVTGVIQTVKPFGEELHGVVIQQSHVILSQLARWSAAMIGRGQSGGGHTGLFG